MHLQMQPNPYHLWTVQDFLAKWIKFEVITVVLALSCHLPMLKCFDFLRLNSKSKTLHTQWTVMILIESNLYAIIWTGDLGKTAALVSNLCPNESDPWLICVLSKDNAQRDSLCCTSSHRQSDSYDSLNDLEKSADKKIWGCFYFAAYQWFAGETYEFWQLWRSSIYQLFLFLSTTWKYFTVWCLNCLNQTGNCWNCRFKAMYRRNQMDRSSFVGVGKAPWRYSVT